MPFLFTLLPLAYFIELNSTSLLVALLLSCVLNALFFGKFIHLIPQIVGVFSFVPVIYERFTPDSFISFVGLGILIYIIIALILFIYDFICNLLGVLTKLSSKK